MLDENGYRPNVGIIIINDEKKVLIGRRLGKDSWQFPQGGFDGKESSVCCMYRELKEELGLDKNHVKILHKTQKWIHYQIPDAINKNKNRYKGQKQIWFLLKFIGNDEDVNLNYFAKPEFDKWEWSDYWRPAELVIDFKKDVYKNVLNYFNELIKND